MGTLIAKAYPAFTPSNKFADHTYVECGTGAKTWSCWGGTTGGRVLRSGTGSTNRANCIAKPDEKAGIKCYAINGVCHQAANRILIAAGITVRGAHGYGLTQALYGTYGRVGFWPCKSPFDQCTSVTGDLPACTPPKQEALKHPDDRELKYIADTLKEYSEAGRLLSDEEGVQENEIANFHINLFKNMVDFELGPDLDKNIAGSLIEIRSATERKLLSAQSQFADKRTGAGPYFDELIALMYDFQDDMGSALDGKQYKQLLDLEPGERVIALNPETVKQQYKIDINT